MEKLAFPFNVRKNCFPNLDTPKLLLIHFANYITGKYLYAVQKLNRIISSVNEFNRKIIFIFI